jgi:hypothetical protein
MVDFKLDLNTPVVPVQAAGADPKPSYGVDLNSPVNVPADLEEQAKQPQYSVFGTPLPGSLAERTGRPQHPLSKAVSQNFDLTDGIKGDDLAINEAIADTFGFNYVEEDAGDGTIRKVKKYNSVTPEMVGTMDPGVRESMKQRQDVKKTMEAVSITRSRLAKDAESVAILRGEINMLYAAEGAMNTFKRIKNGYEFDAMSEALGAAPEKLGMILGLVSAGARGGKNRDSAFAVAEGLAALASGGTEEDMQKAAVFFKQAWDYAKRAEGMPRSEAADEFLRAFATIDNVGTPEGFLKAAKIFATNLYGAASTIQEIVAEQAGPLIAQIGARLIAGPAGGAIVSAGTNYAQEQFGFTPEARDNIKKKFGYDLTTEKGISSFVRDTKAVDAFIEFGAKRGVIIAALDLVGLGVLRAFSRTNLNRLSKIAVGTFSEATTSFTGESLASIWSGQGFKLSDSLLESMAGAHPVSVGIEAYTAGAADYRDFTHSKQAKEWLKSGEATRDTIAGLPAEKLARASDVLADKLKSDGIDTVYIKADELLKFDQDGSAADTLGLTSEAVQSAAAEGQDVAIDAATYIRHILGKDGFDALMRHTRFDIAGMTAEEADNYTALGIGDQIEQALQDKALARIAPSIDKTQLAKLNEDLDLIKSTVSDMLAATGQYEGRKADLFAQLTAQRYASRAIRMTEETGKPIDALALFDADNLRIQGSDTRTGVARSPEFARLLEQQAFNQKFVGTGTVKVTPAEQAFFDEVLGNEVNRAELLEAVPSLAVKDGSLSVAAEDIDAFLSAMNDFVISDGAISVPPRLRALTSSRDIVSKMEFNQTAKEFNVTPEQLKAELEAAGGDITQTPAFKAWFGDSKVVDADGKPLVVYHGTAADFEAFDLVFSKDGVQGKGFYFTTRKPLAEDYAYGANRDQEGRLIEAYVSLKNPVIKRPGVPLSSEEIAAIRSDFAEGGYDGFIEYLPSGGINTVIATGSTQIKSVNNRGTFDPNDNRILYQDIAQAEAELGKAFSEERIPALEEAARQRSEGEITQAQYDAIVTELKPIRPYTTVPTPATEAQMRSALKAGQQERVGKGNQFVGDNVGLRLDIPAYTNHGTWVPTMHDQKGKPIAHEAAAKITGVSFTQPGDAAERKAARVGTGETSKSPFAQINGTLQSVDPASLQAEMEAALNDPAWTQVGYDPRRHTFFYDRSTQQPILSADEVIQVGPLVMAKNAVSGDGAAFLFQDQDGVGNSLKSAQTLLRDNPEALGLTPDLVGYVNQIYRPDVIPAKKMAGNKAVAAWLEKAFPGVSITDMTATLPPETIERIATIMAAEAQLGLENTGSAFDWYSGALNRALDVVQIKYPMVADDKAAADAGFGTAENARFVFTYIMAVTSQNLDVKANSVATDKIFAQMLDKVKSGDFTMDKSWGTGDKRKAMGENFAKFGPLIQAMEGDTFPEKIANLNNLFRDSRSVTEWVKDMKAAGIPYSKPGQTAMSSIVYGSSLLGPKIGNGFWQNLNGNFNPLTIDLWMRRTWGRLTGKSIGNPEALPTQRKRFKAAIERSRSNEHGAPDLIADMKQMLENIDEQIAIITDPERFSWTGSKKAQTAYLKSLKAERKLLSEALPDMEGIKAPEPWNASYAKDDAALLAYAKRVLKVWDVEYKRLREENDAVPAELQPTWARAAKTIITNLAKPLDQVNNGTQRTQIEAAGRRALEILKERGIELTTADLQALLWYPEKELWGALGTKLEVDEDGTPIVPPSSLNESYDTTFSRILREQGYAVEGIAGDEVAGSGAGTVAGGDARSQRPEGVAGAGQAGSAGRGTAALSQGEAGAPRGSFAPSDLINDQDGNPVNLIQIFEGADPSTFLHESGHFWLEMLKADAQSVGGQFQKDWSIVNDWWGLRSLEIKDEAIRRAKKKKDKAALAVLEKMTDAQVKAYIRKGDLRGSSDPAARFLSVSMHEQFARGTEEYFRTARAPSIGLASLFNSFRVWIGSVYRGMLGMDVSFSPEVREVLDRMIASDEEIEAANGQFEMAALFDDASQAGMSKEEFSNYHKGVEEGRNQSKANQLAKHMRQMRTEKTVLWEEQREAMRPEVTSEIANQRAFKLVFGITQGGLADGSTLQDGERIPRINGTVLKALMEEEGLSLKDLPRVGGKAIYSMSTKEGETSDPGAAAAAYGYDDVITMIAELTELNSFPDAVNVAIDERMKKEHGSIDDTGDQEAIASIHGDHIAKVMAAELQALRTSEPAFKPAFIRQYAADKISNMKTGEIKHHLFTAAERRHAKLAKQAIKSGDKATAYKHQFQRLVNHRLAEASLKARSDIDKKQTYLKKFGNKKKKFESVAPGYISTIRTIIEATDFRTPISERARLKAELQAINAFVEKAKNNDGAVLEMPAWLVERDALTNVRDMTYQEFLEMHESVSSLERQGKLAKKIRSGMEYRDRQEVIGEMIETLSGRDVTRVNKINDQWADKPEGMSAIYASGLELLAVADAQLLKVEFLLEALDGKPLGPWHQALYQPFAAAAVARNELSATASKLIADGFKSLPKAIRQNMGRRVDVGGLGTPGMKMTRGQLIMLALNTGNESNLDKVIRGFGGDKKSNVRGAGWNINEDLISKALDQLSAEEWKFIQSIWDHAEILWPDVARIYEAENGVAPERVEPRVIKTKHGDFSGGYFPLQYDHRRPYDASSSRMEQKNALEMMQSSVGRASVNSSMTKGRTGYAAPIKLDIEDLARTFDNSIHFITHYDAVRNAKKIITDPDLRFELENVVGKEYAKELDNWVAALANNNQPASPANFVERTGNWLMKNTTMAVLGASYTTLAAQSLGLTVGLDALVADQKTYGPIEITVAAADLAYGLSLSLSPAHYKSVMQASPFMRFRRENYDREVKQVLKASKGRIVGSLTTIKERTITEWGMQAIAEAQFFSVDLPVWTASYNRALRADPGDERGAIAYADRTVRRSQSSGDLIDLSAVQRQGKLTKLFTMFYTFFSALYAILRGVGGDLMKNASTSPASAISRAATRAFVLLTLQAVGTGLIRGELPDLEPEDEDAEGLLGYLAKETALSALGTVPFVRDLSTGALKGYGYSMSPAGIFGDAFVKSVAAVDKLTTEGFIEDAEYTALVRQLKPLILLGGTLTGVPSVQINRSLDGAAAYFDESYGWHWSDSIRGYDPKRADRRN